MRKTIYWLAVLTLVGVLGYGCGQGPLTSGIREDPAVGIVKRTLMVDGYWEDFCNRAAGVDGKVEWVGGPASALSNVEGVEKYKNNPDLRIVVVRVEKNRTGKYSKAGIVFVVNNKTKIVEVIHTELDGKPEAPLMTVASMELMVMQGSK